MSRKTTYSVVVRDPNSWNPSTGIHEELNSCGHRHHSVAAAQNCIAKLTAAMPDGSVVAAWYHARVEDNSAHRAISEF